MGEQDELDVSTFAETQGLLPLLCAASIQGRSALGSEPGSRVERRGIPELAVPGRAVVIKELCAELEGFSLHAAVRVEADQTSRLEHLCRYITRPPISNKRLSFAPDGRVVHELRAPFRDGTTHFVFEPLAFIERLAALVPPPRLHQLTYHGVLAPASSWRSDIVPRAPARRRSSCSSAEDDVLPLHRYSFADLMRRVFRIDVLKCATCGSERRWIAAITSSEAIMKILDHLDLPNLALERSPARAPPQVEFEFEGC